MPTLTDIALIDTIGSHEIWRVKGGYRVQHPPHEKMLSSQVLLRCRESLFSVLSSHTCESWLRRDWQEEDRFHERLAPLGVPKTSIDIVRGIFYYLVDTVGQYEIWRTEASPS